MKLEFITQTPQETKNLGEKMGNLSKPNMVWTMSGDLGAGKTTLTQGIARGLGITRTVSSPTFTILKIYQGRLPLYHFDAYRLEGTHQELGFEEMIDGEGLTVIEWPEYMETGSNAAAADHATSVGRGSSSDCLGNGQRKYIELMEALK